MRSRLLRVVPLLITLGIVGLLFLLEALSWVVPKFDALERLERMTYDWRVRLAARQTEAPPYVGAVYVDEDTLGFFNVQTNGGFQWPLPRFLYGQAVEELKLEGARAVAFDIFFVDRNYERDHLEIPGSPGVNSDEFFARKLREAGNVILSAPQWEVEGSVVTLAQPIDLFRTNAAGVGFTMLEIDSDGVRRRCRPFIDDPDARQRFWHTGILLAAARLNLDLDKARMQGRNLVIPGQGNVQRSIPLDEEGCFYVHWGLRWEDLPPEQQNNLAGICMEAQERKRGHGKSAQFRDRLVVVGGAGTGNNVGDRGPTPFDKETILCSSLWNIAISVLENRFVQRSSTGLELLLIAGMAGLAGVLTSRLRAVGASLAVLAVALIYVAIAVFVYSRFLYWLPVVLPVGGALLMTYICLVGYRLVVELVEKRRVQFVRNAFGQRFTDDVVAVLVQEENPRAAVKFLGLPPSVVRMLVQKDAGAEPTGVRRRVSIFFADIRNFTEFIDSSYARAEVYVQENRLSPPEAEHYMDLAARDLLGTVNLYLSTIAEVVRGHNGTLDKYVGDAVMAFWGAPVADERHAVACVHGAIAAQAAIGALNRQREAENRKRQQLITTSGYRKGTMPMLPILTVGMAVNSGEAIVGFMGSAALMSNYTVFGAEVNVASRLEGLARSGRIVVSESTYRDLQQFEPALAASCIALEPVTLRGIRKPVRIYELAAEAAAASAGASPAAYGI